MDAIQTQYNYIPTNTQYRTAGWHACSCMDRCLPAQCHDSGVRTHPDKGWWH